MKNNFYKKTLILAFGGAVLFSSVGFKSDFFEIAKQIEIFTMLFKEINMNYVDETSPADLMDTAIKSMLTDLDPYTNFWSEQDVQSSRIDMAGEYTGIGAVLKSNGDNLLITEVYKDYPADEAGLKPGDEITKIGDTKVADFTENAGALLNGSMNSKIVINYTRQGNTQEASIKRSSVELKAVPFYTLLEDQSGYIVLSRFNQKAYEETSRAVKDLKSKGAEKIILDLRGNPGGLLSEAINVSNIFLDKGELITSTKSVIEKYNKEYYTQKEPIDTKIPLVVLVNGQSASASEIVSGAIQDLDRGVVVGARTFGKGLVQRPKEIAYGTQLKITISRYYTPSGRCIQALDYRRRDENGKAVRTKVEDYNAFKTKNGRTVYDGGGILPDVRLESSEYSSITRALLEKNAVFDFATEYYYQNSVEDPLKYEFSDAEFNDFKSYLKTSNFSYKTATEQELEELLITAQSEGFQQDILDSYKQITQEIDKSKAAELDEKKEEIKAVLQDEIIKRYFYQEGLYENHVANSREIKKAREVLNNPAQYAKILEN
ncbi:S41 family peptidase [Zunongwangia sp. HGR-M22]|uniref:S41 family peptidase n=1 Tax=Zunongwangia sp. HGR-M22 TaxID=3015168 RepID=UPI0022DE5D73|nr:S41 family peptidase [Zunongwangia sp. HGR-M22]WBL25685.1 S41 family peptidase [Zunongwangia sp. HGR-M22]